MHRYFFLLIAVGALLFAGCRPPQTVKDAWKGTRSYYYRYLNTPAKLNLADKGSISDYESALGFAIADFDLQLQELERALQNSDLKPDAEWAAAMTKRFPWLSGIVLTDSEGTPQAKIPPDFPKPFSIGNLLEVDPKQQIKDLRAFVQDDPLGPEIYIGNPVYIGGDFRGVIIAHFDPRTLLARTGDVAQIMLAGPDGVIWPGIYDAAATPLAKVPWGERVKSDVSGVVRNDLGEFFWVCRYIGNLPLVYAIRIEGEFPLREENMQGIDAANAMAIGPIDVSRLQPPPDRQESPDGGGVPPVEIAPDGRNSPLEQPSPKREKSEQTGAPLAE